MGDGPKKKDLFIHSYLKMKTLNNTKGGACLLLIWLKFSCWHFWSYQSYTCDLFLLALKINFENLPPFYYIGVDSTYLLGAIFWPKGQKVDICDICLLTETIKGRNPLVGTGGLKLTWNPNEICSHFTWPSILLTYTFLLSSTISGCLGLAGLVY